MEKAERNKITNLESLTLGNCNITLTLDTRYKVYLRAIRVVFKACISSGYLREKDYPFSATDSAKVKIPSGTSRKSEFLTVDQMTELYDFYLNGEIPKEYKHPEEMKQSLGMFLAQYLFNGCNLYDLALVRYDDYYDISEHKALRFFRHKTRDHSESGSEVIIPIIPPLKRLLDDLAAPAKKGSLVFPFLLGESVDPDSKQARNKIHQELPTNDCNMPWTSIVPTSLRCLVICVQLICWKPQVMDEVPSIMFMVLNLQAIQETLQVQAKTLQPQRKTLQVQMRIMQPQRRTLQVQRKRDFPNWR